MTDLNYIALIEHNENEGETWTHWIPMQGNGTAIEKLREILDKWAQDAPYDPAFELGDIPAPESEVDALVKYSTTTYMAEHTKLAGVLTVPDGLTFTDLYKGGIEDFCKNGAA